MNVRDIIRQLEQQRADLAAQRATQRSVITTVQGACLGENRDPSDAEATQVTEAQRQVTDLDTRLDALDVELRARRTEAERDESLDAMQREVNPGAVPPAERAPAERAPATVTSEPRTYSERSAREGVSFFGDAFSMRENGNVGATQRIQRHQAEVEVERQAGIGIGTQERATSTTSFAGLVVPQYLVDQAAAVVRAGRPFADTVQHLPLPAQGTQFQIPVGTTGAATAVQAAENTSVQNTDQVWANVTVNVATIAGQQDVSRQSLERGTPGIDGIIYLDLAGAYGVNLDQQTISGSGSSGQMKGALNATGINQATAFTAAATAATFYSKVAGMISAIQTNRLLAPTVIAMHPRRWNWLLSQVDSSNRPLAVPNLSSGMAMNAMAISEVPQDTPSANAVGYFLGLPVITDATLPINVGTASEDVVLVYRNTDLLLWEDGDGMPRELRFEQTLGNQLTVKLVVYGYAAFTAERYPKAVGVVGGNAGAGFGLVAPTF